MFKNLILFIFVLSITQYVEAASCRIYHKTEYTSKIDDILKVIKKNALESVTEEGLNVEKFEEEIKIDIENEIYVINETKTIKKDQVIFDYKLQDGGKLKIFEGNVTYTARPEGGTSVVNNIKATYIDSGVTSLSLDILLRSQIIKIHKKTKRALGEQVDESN